MDFRYEQSLVRDLLDEQFPQYAELELRDVDGGWDNQQWRLGEDLGVRLPRTERGPFLIGKEQRWLPDLAKSLPLPVSTPIHHGKPSKRFEHPWSITKWVPGEPADHAPVTGEGAATTLAEFLNALHQPAPADAPTSQDRGVKLQNIAEPAFSLIENPESRAAAEHIWHEALAAEPYRAEPVWLHGDLHPANVITRHGELAGVIDFGDMCAGDPATDLAAAWVLLPDGAADDFWTSYGNEDDNTKARSKGWAVLKALGLLYVGRNGRLGKPGGKPTWEPAGYATLTRMTN